MSLINDDEFAIALLRRELFYACEDKVTQQLVGSSLKSLVLNRNEKNLYMTPLLPSLQEAINIVGPHSPPINFNNAETSSHLAKKTDSKTSILEDLAGSDMFVADAGPVQEEADEDAEISAAKKSDEKQARNVAATQLEAPKFEKTHLLQDGPRQQGVSKLGLMLMKKAQGSSNPFADTYSVFVCK
jgi:hypothetical protein